MSNPKTLRYDNAVLKIINFYLLILKDFLDGLTLAVDDE